MQQISTPPSALSEQIVNENFETVSHQQVYGKKHSTTNGLIWGYYGGLWGDEFDISDGTLTLSGSATNYVVVAKATGVISTSTTNTNWNNTDDYARVYKITTTAGEVSGTPEDHRATIYGVHGGGGGGGGGGSVDLTSDVTGILPLANGGTGAALTDPNADRILFWDDSAGATAFLTPGTGLSITGTTLNASTGGDASTNTSVSIDGEMALFNGTTGKEFRRASFTGLAKVSAGIPSAATEGADYWKPGGTDVAISDGGTGASSASAARANLSAASTTQTAEQFCGFIASPSNKDYRIVLDTAHGGTITSVVTRCSTGTCTATFKINTTALGGTANSVSSTEQTQSQSSSNVFGAGDDLVLTVSSNSSCVDMSFTIKYTRTYS